MNVHFSQSNEKDDQKDKCTIMDDPSGASSPKDAHDVPEWANWPLKPDGKLDMERLMPTTFLVCSKEYSKSRQDLAKSLPSLAPKRHSFETKSVPTISNLTLLELYDLAGEEILEFRTYILETLGESDRINNTETLMNDHDAIKMSMKELRKVANEIHNKKTREESTVFLNKRANLAILGYFTRQDPRNQTAPLPIRPVKRQFKEFISGNRGAARVSVYNWRHKLWGASVSRNLSMSPPDRVALLKRSMNANRRFASMDSTSNVMRKLETDDTSHSDGVEGGKECTSSTVSGWNDDDQSTVSPSEAKKIKMEPGFNLKNAIGKGREEVNFYCAVNANKVSPGDFGLPKGFVKCGNKIVHHTKKESVQMSVNKRRRQLIKKEVLKGKDNVVGNTGEGSVRKSIKKEEEEIEKLNESNESDRVILDDIEDDNNEMESDEEIDISVDRSIVVTTESFTQTDDTVMTTENGDTLVDPEIAKHLEKLESIHSEDMGIIQKLRVENGLAVRNLSKYHNKYVSLMVERNNIKFTYNIADKERKAEKIANSQLTKTVKNLTQQNSLLLDEVNTLKRELAIRDQMEFANREVGRYEEFSG
ncbi:hypothetical protein PRIPAC_84434 [Pristionchus pacificus]|uniref:Uncharacterized protein n=1 Tax=Pristionchus pacificus TaxID=54126 RepID=A0A2A6BW33_PRIPA|nr:hypothetical protein PRIPAC_84434 [Pristionchus pacificus]|eukprot:PDM70109.1 hypothetical protein PRIPAC_43849 [Pristionchus pacificus]